MANSHLFRERKHLWQEINITADLVHLVEIQVVETSVISMKINTTSIIGFSKIPMEQK
jgi:hypothetical protein